MTVNELIQSGALQTFEGETITADAVSGGTLVSVNPSTLRVRVAEGVAANLLLLHTKPMQTLAEVELAEGSSLSMGDVYLAGSFADVKVNQCASSECRMVVVQLGDANVTYDVALNGKEAASSLHGVFVGTDSEHVVFDLTTRHNVSDCRSESLVKGVVSGRAAGEFRGLVYVAQDAQRTDAEQINRNIELDGGRIYSEPQLEIYADDVKCSHGSTVGQLDEQSLYYMRQRGIPCEVAERMLLEGFVEDIVDRCDIEELKEFITFNFD